MVDAMIVIGVIGLIFMLWLMLRKGGAKDMQQSFQREFGSKRMSPSGESEYEKEIARQKARRDFREKEIARQREDKRVKNARSNFAKNVFGGDIRKGVRDNIGHW